MQSFFHNILQTCATIVHPTNVIMVFFCYRLVILALSFCFVTAQFDLAISPCLLNIDPGPCKAYFPKWGYKNGCCVQFIYGGCLGNKNRFDSKAQCEQSCPTTNCRCKLPVVQGRCLAWFPRWASVDGCCKPFIYGGCGGNANRFISQAECERICGNDGCPIAVARRISTG